MWFIADFENILTVDVTETIVGGLEIVDGLSHITLGSEDYGLQAIVSVAKALRLAELQQTL